MAKRTRYPGHPESRRPGGRPATAKPAGAPVRTGGLTQAELDRAAELEAEMVAREKAAIADNARRRSRTRGVSASISGDASVPLSVRAAHEYAYVARDVRRIGLTAGLVFGILAVIWVIVNVGGARIA